MLFSAIEYDQRLLNKQVNSVYFTANISYANKIFFDVSGRNRLVVDPAQRQNNSFFLSVGFDEHALMNEWFEMPDEINLVKLRLSWAQVGNDTDPYKTSQYYATTNFPGSGKTPHDIVQYRFQTRNIDQL